MTQKSKVAVIGLGNIGTAVATNLITGNRPVIVADQKRWKRQKDLQATGKVTTIGNS